ncbi:MAG: quinate 5-dehydrogenase [Armatimonadetes bacterium]|nr:quinate 5-dehydrogenase [Armatimonadota bacterium]
MSEASRVVSVSLGSSSRDRVVRASFLGQAFQIERRGTDGSLDRACALVRELDGKVAAIGLGGIDLYLVAGRRRWVVRDARRIADCARVTPVVDGSGLKNTLERETVRFLQQRGLIAPADGTARLPRILVVSAVDRFGMAEACTEFPCERVFGDVIFALRLPVPIRNLGTIEILARLLLPIICRQPFQVLYPTGDEQGRRHTRGARWFRWADVIGGDYHYIGTNLPRPSAGEPQPLAGKMVITNTTTEKDVARLRSLGLARLVTTTPRLEGRSFGTNVMECVLVALSGKHPEDLHEADYLELLQRLGWQPEIVALQP